jgi:hypothetical protein
MLASEPLDAPGMNSKVITNALKDYFTGFKLIGTFVIV